MSKPVTAGAALRSAYDGLKARGTSLPAVAPMYGFGDFNALMGFPRVWEFEREHGEG